MESVQRAFYHRCQVLRVEPLEEKFECAAGDEATKDALQYVEEFQDFELSSWHLLELVSANAKESVDLRHELVQVACEITDELLIDPQ